MYQRYHILHAVSRHLNFVLKSGLILPASATTATNTVLRRYSNSVVFYEWTTPYKHLCWLSVVNKGSNVLVTCYKVHFKLCACVTKGCLIRTSQTGRTAWSYVCISTSRLNFNTEMDPRVMVVRTGSNVVATDIMIVFIAPIFLFLME